MDFVQKALLVHEKAFTIPHVMASIQVLESLGHGKKGPYDSLTKLAGIVKKAKDPPVIEWVFATITDQVVSKQARSEDFSVRFLLGDTKTGRGVVDTYIMKFRMLEYMNTSLADQLGLPSEVKEKLREVLGSHESYRKCLSPIGVASDPGLQPDLKWRSGWARSSIMYLSFVERVVYSEDYDASLRTATKMGKGVQDILAYESFANKWGQLQEVARKEKADEKKDDGATAAGGPAGPGAGDQPRAAGEPGAGGQAATDGEGGNDDMRLLVEAQRIVHSNITLFVEPESQTELKSAIVSSTAGKRMGKDGSECPRASRVRGHARRTRWWFHPHASRVAGCARRALLLHPQAFEARYVLVVYDYKQASESKTNPQTRIAPLRDARCLNSIVATIDARRTVAGSAVTHLVPGDLYCVFDGSRPGNVNKLRLGFVDEEGQALPKFERKLMLIYSEDCAAKRRAVVRGTGSVKQQEGLLLLSRHKVKVPRRKRKHFDGTSAGDTFVNIPAVGPDEEWRLPLGIKKLLYAQYRVEVGGKGPDSGSEESAASGDDEPPAKARQGVGGGKRLPLHFRCCPCKLPLRSPCLSAFPRARRSACRPRSWTRSLSPPSTSNLPAASWRSFCTWPTPRL